LLSALGARTIVALRARVLVALRAGPLVAFFEVSGDVCARSAVGSVAGPAAHMWS